MKRLAVFVVVFIFFPSFVLCANVDSSLYTGNNQQLINKYERLLLYLKKPDNINYDTQKTILYTLINILKYSNENLIFNPKKVRINNQMDYMELFQRIAKIELKYKSLDDRVDNIKNKLQLLKESINSIKDNSSDVMTYNLQYAFYQITLQKLEKEKLFLSKKLPDWLHFLYAMLLATKLEEKSPRKFIKDDLEQYNRLSDYVGRLNIEKDRLTILGRQNGLSSITNKLEESIKTRDSVSLNIINNYILIYLYRLQHSKSLNDAENNIKKWIRKLVMKNNMAFANEESNLLYYITKNKMGVFKTFLKQFENNTSHALDAVWGFVKKPLFNVGNANISILNITLAFLIFMLGIYVGRTYKKHIKTARFSKNIPLSTKTILGNMGYYTIILMTFFISLRVIGINLSSLTVILGALSVGVGFGLQNMVSNFISGIILMLENSIRIGDYIEISDTLKGVVKDIQMRSTTITTNDNIEVIIPNQTLFQNNVINWTLTEKVRRFKVPFGVAYGTDINKMQTVVLNALENSNLSYIKNIPDKAPEIKMVAMDSSSVNFNLDVWVSGDDVVYPRRTESKFLIMIYNVLYENDIAIPFPQLDIHVKEPIVLEKNDNSQTKFN